MIIVLLTFTTLLSTTIPQAIAQHRLKVEGVLLIAYDKQGYFNLWRQTGKDSY
ncbi:hypothetical protein [Capnocytophaga haemolytica]